MSRPVRVLCLDDNLLDRERIRDVLAGSASDFQLTEAPTRREFESRLSEGQDVVLAELDVVDYEGLEILGAVRDACPDVPVVIFTGRGCEEIAVEALKQGAADYVVKTPENMRRLPDIIGAVLQSSHVQRERRKTESG